MSEDGNKHKESITTRIRPELLDMLETYENLYGYSRSDAVRRLLEKALFGMNMGGGNLEAESGMEIAKLRQRMDGIDSKINKLEKEFEQRNAQSSRVANLEDRVRRLESLEWENRPELDGDNYE